MGGAQGNVNKDCICLSTYLKLLMSSSRPLCLAGLHAILKVVIWLFLRAYQGSTLSMDVWCQVLLPLPCQWHLDVLASKSLPVDCKYSDSGANCNLQQKTMVQRPQICPTPALLSAILKKKEGKMEYMQPTYPIGVSQLLNPDDSHSCTREPGDIQSEQPRSKPTGT